MACCSWDHICRDSQAWPTAPDSGSGRACVRRFSSGSRWEKPIREDKDKLLLENRYHQVDSVVGCDVSYDCRERRMGPDRGGPDSLSHCDSPWLTTDATDDEVTTAFVERVGFQKATNTHRLIPSCPRFDFEHRATGGN